VPDPPVVRVLVVDDHPVVCDGVRALVFQTPDIEVVGVTHERRSDMDIWLNYARRMGFEDRDGDPPPPWSTHGCFKIMM
jgi:hypothetical protein